MAHILIADDNDCTRNALASLLRLHGHRVRCAAEGAAALRLLDEEAPDVVVLDLMMPEVDGLDVLRHIRASLPLAAVPVLVCSASAQAELREEAMRLGARAFVQKGAGAIEALKRLLEPHEVPEAREMPPAPRE